jgi:hypothetical protein
MEGVLARELVAELADLRRAVCGLVEILGELALSEVEQEDDRATLKRRIARIVREATKGAGWTPGVSDYPDPETW